jgi:hypothetical protein
MYNYGMYTFFDGNFSTDLKLFTRNFSPETFRRKLLAGNFSTEIFLRNFFDEFFDDFFYFSEDFFDLLTIASFRIGVPSILFNCTTQN